MLYGKSGMGVPEGISSAAHAIIVHEDVCLIAHSPGAQTPAPRANNKIKYNARRQSSEVFRRCLSNVNDGGDGIGAELFTASRDKL